MKPHHVTAGCTACVCLLCGNKIYCANAGDSRAVMCRNGKAIPLSYDHKPNQVNENARIRKGINSFLICKFLKNSL